VLQSNLAKGRLIINIGSVASTLTPPASSIYQNEERCRRYYSRIAKELDRRTSGYSINPGVIDNEGARAMETYEQVANEIKT